MTITPQKAQETLQLIDQLDQLRSTKIDSKDKTQTISLLEAQISSVMQNHAQELLSCVMMAYRYSTMMQAARYLFEDTGIVSLIRGTEPQMTVEEQPPSEDKQAASDPANVIGIAPNENPGK